MTERDKQRQLDALAMRYLAAVDAGDFDTIDTLWAAAEHDDALSEMFHGLNAEIRAAHRSADDVRTLTDANGTTLADALAKLPSALPSRPSKRIGRSAPWTVWMMSRTSRMLSVPCGSWHCAHGMVSPGGTWVATRDAE